jgi:hypothetical protein
MIWAPPTCSRAISSASYFLFLNQSKDFREPVTLVRSPRSQKTLSGVIIKGSNPDKIKFLLFSAAIFYCICSCRFQNRVGVTCFFIIWACSPRRIYAYIFCSAIAAQRMPLLSLTRVLCIVRSFCFNQTMPFYN